MTRLYEFVAHLKIKAETGEEAERIADDVADRFIHEHPNDVSLVLQGQPRPRVREL